MTPDNLLTGSDNMFGGSFGSMNLGMGGFGMNLGISDNHFGGFGFGGFSNAFTSIKDEIDRMHNSHMPSMGDMNSQSFSSSYSSASGADGEVHTKSNKAGE